jgi:hypothetical protein
MKVKDLSKEMLIEAGGKHWEKGTLERVYLNDESIAKAFDLKLVEKQRFGGEFSPIKKAKVWFDCKSETMHSDVGMVRVMFNGNGIKCTK